jgi:hypothetical protein
MSVLAVHLADRAAYTNCCPRTYTCRGRLHSSQFVVVPRPAGSLLQLSYCGSKNLLYLLKTWLAGNTTSVVVHLNTQNSNALLALVLGGSGAPPPSRLSLVS